MIQESFRKYMNKDILAWMTYNTYASPGQANTRCYIRPCAAINANKTLTPYKANTLIEDFPTIGSIEVILSRGETAEELFRKCGALVQIRINKEPKLYSQETTNHYSLLFDRQRNRDQSPIWISPFNGKGFYQVLEVSNSMGYMVDHRNIPLPRDPIVTTQILLHNSFNGKYFGPFDYDQKNDELVLSAAENHDYIIGEFENKALDDLLCDVYDEDNEISYQLMPATSIAEPKTCKTNHDWISDDKLLECFINDLENTSTIDKSQLQIVKTKLQNAFKVNKSINFSKERQNRLAEIFSRVEEDDTNINNIISYIFSQPNLTASLTQNPKGVAANQTTETKNISDNLEVEKKTSKRGRKSKTTQLSLESVAAETTADPGEIEKLQEKIKSLEAQLEEAEEKAEAEHSITYLKLQQARYQEASERARKEYEEQTEINRTIEYELQACLDDFNDEATVISKVVESKLLERVLSGIGGEKDQENIEIPGIHPLNLHEQMTSTEIIERVSSYVIDKGHRSLTFNDIANYLLCISQGFITTFAGDPGTGKTSLCNLLARALGLVTNDQTERFLEISVERGWTSNKDYIGYYNPLTKSLVKSNAAAFNAFSRLDMECGNGVETYDPAQFAPFLILLDEANLSPVEHYWAAFLKLCDFNTAKREIYLGGNSVCRIPEHLRFLATVNFDHTTEELSPRFLDRSWIVTMQPSRIDDDYMDDVVENADDMISFASIKKAFMPNKTDHLSEIIASKWDTIQSIFRSDECDIPIAPRNLKMVRNYCAVACRVMQCDTPSTRLAPLDYAFSQKVLPTINGTGDRYKRLVDELLKECTDQNMPLSAKHLKRMQRVAEDNMGFYHFFAR